MRTLTLGLLLGALFATSPCVSAAQESVAVFPVEGANVDPGDLDAIGALLASAYAEQSHLRVLGPAETEHALSAAEGAKPAAAAQLGVTRYVDTRVIRVGRRIIVHATLRSRDGAQLYVVKTTALSMEDMEPVSERVAASLEHRTSLEETRTRDNIIAKETRGRNRLFAEKVIGLRTGVVVSFAPQIEQPASLILDFDAKLEAERYFLEIAAGFRIPSGFDTDGVSQVGGLSALLGASYYLTPDNVAPYIGAGISPRILAGVVKGAGLAVHGDIGVMFMRTSSSRFYAEFTIDQNLIGLTRRIESSDTPSYVNGLYTYSDHRSWPVELGLAAGIGW